MPKSKTKSKLKLLLVDDNEVIRLIFKDIFWIHNLDQKYELKVTADVEKAKKLIKNKSTRPDIVFSGLVMPIKKQGRTRLSPEAGFGILKFIKKDPELKNIRVFIFSGHDDPQYKKKAKKMGAEKFLFKTEHLPQDLVKKLEEIWRL